jgi:polysaccharide biosynthesis protein PelF
VRKLVSNPIDLADVDVAIVMESTYPYLKGGVSAVVHDIVTENSDLTYGIIHIAWDASSPTEDLYGVPPNVAWIHTLFLSMEEHRHDFMALTPKVLGMRREERAVLAHRLFDALAAVPTGDMEPMWALFDEGINPLTRRYPLWALLGSREFMHALRDRMPGLGLSLTESFWLMREFFSLTHALLSEELPRAKVYHAHTTGYACLISAAAARQHGRTFLLTEHNLYVRDTVNTLLDRNMALPVRGDDWREFDVTPIERAWMAWWIEMGRFCYPSADHITYLYQDAIPEARALGAPTDDELMSIVPNGMMMSNFDEAYTKRSKAREEILAGDDRTWRLAYIARVVPIKGLYEFISSAGLLVERGVTNWSIDILGPTDHVPAAYLTKCLDKIKELDLEDYFVFRGTVNVRAVLGDYDLLVLPSFNEGQPMVVLEAMTAGIPTVGTAVGGMRALVVDRLNHESGRVWEAGGVLVEPVDLIPGIAEAIQYVLSDADAYERMAANARGRVEGFFQLRDAMALYDGLYRRLAKLPPARTPAGVPSQSAPARIPAPARSHGGPYRGRARVPHAIRPLPRVPSHAAAIGIAKVPSRPHAGAYVIHRAPMPVLEVAGSDRDGRSGRR